MNPHPTPQPPPREGPPLADLVPGSHLYVAFTDEGSVQGVLTRVDERHVTLADADPVRYPRAEVAYVEVEAWPAWLRNLVRAHDTGRASLDEVTRAVALALDRSGEEAIRVIVRVAAHPARRLP